ncbi:twin-arginine translocase subunit TatC [Sanyastnella coralliicola]|uniref:twin-arginine translocase subunit TatC n=1 Tax=Sanyastnella coralliicola TaxID=3069118 RepID=UPI0027B8A3F4|nr:twin-arginine translocase subunit TatC [Longitalea sp. SCSIO 12813]
MSEDKNDMSFLEHLEELRFRLMRSVIAIFVIAIVFFIFKDFVFDEIIFGPRQLDFPSFRAWCKLSDLLGLGERLCVKSIDYKIINTTMLGKFTAHIMVSLIGGFITAFPYVFWEFWRFIKPGLRQTESSAVRGVVFYTALLFFSGVLFGYYGIVPLSLQFLGNYKLADVESTITIMSYMKLVASITLATGIIFQLPIAVYFLSKAGIVTPELLKKFRRHALVAVLVLSAIITPPDLTSQILVAMPVLVLYELSIVISRRVWKKARERDQEFA